MKAEAVDHQPAGFVVGTPFLVMSADMRTQVKARKAVLTALAPEGAWLKSSERDNETFPRQEEVLLVVFLGRDTYTHRCRILQRKRDEALISRPSLTKVEKSQLEPFTGRHDYRVEAYYPAEIRTIGEDSSTEPRYCHLCDLSRGGMGLEVPATDHYASGSEVEVRLVSWDYPVRLRAEVVRSWPTETAQRVALIFRDDLPEIQKDLISQFILDAQRREATRS